MKIHINFQTHEQINPKFMWTNYHINIGIPHTYIQICAVVYNFFISELPFFNNFRLQIQPVIIFCLNNNYMFIIKYYENLKNKS